MPYVKDLDVAFRAYIPAYQEVGYDTPDEITMTNISQVREATGLTWEPAVEKQFRVRELGLGQTSVEPVDGYRYITRGPGGPVLGSLKDSYHLFGNDELFGIAAAIGEAAVAERKEVKFLAGGELDGGRKVFLLADLGVVDIPGDPSPHARFMTLLSSHDGGGAVKVLGTDMRWHCTNALRAAEINAAAQGAAFSFRHTSRVQRRVEDAKQAMTAAILQHEQVARASAELLAKRVRPGAASAYLAQFALAQVVAKANPMRETVASFSPQRQHAVTAVERDLTAILASRTCDGIRDTAYGPFAAVVEYLDNVRPAASPSTRFSRTLVTAERGKRLAYELAGKTLL